MTNTHSGAPLGCTFLAAILLGCVGSAEVAVVVRDAPEAGSSGNDGSPDSFAQRSAEHGGESPGVVVDDASDPGCVAATFRSTARPYADWGWNDGAQAWAGFRVPADGVGGELGCSVMAPDMASGPHPTAAGEWLAIEIRDDGAARLLEPPADSACAKRWDPFIRVRGCGLVSYMSTWMVEVFDLTTGCRVGFGRETDSGALVEDCGTPIVVGELPPPCDDELIEGWCAER